MPDPDITLLLARLERLNAAVLGDAGRRHGLDASEWRVLAVLRHSGDAVSPTTLSRWIVQTSAGITATVRRLERRGHVERRGDPDDGRGRLVVLTDQGRAAYDAMSGDLAARYDDAFRSLPADRVVDLLRGLVGSLERAAGLPAASDFTVGDGDVACPAGRP